MISIVLHLSCFPSIPSPIFTTVNLAFVQLVFTHSLPLHFFQAIHYTI